MNWELTYIQYHLMFMVRLDPAREKGSHLIAEYIASRKGRSPDTEQAKLLNVLSSLMLQRNAVAINRGKLDLKSSL